MREVIRALKVLVRKWRRRRGWDPIHPLRPGNTKYDRMRDAFGR